MSWLAFDSICSICNILPGRAAQQDAKNGFGEACQVIWKNQIKFGNFLDDGHVVDGDAQVWGGQAAGEEAEEAGEGGEGGRHQGEEQETVLKKEQESPTNYVKNAEKNGKRRQEKTNRLSWRPNHICTIIAQ